jgi:hypothetical protein
VGWPILILCPTVVGGAPEARPIISEYAHGREQEDYTNPDFHTHALFPVSVLTENTGAKSPHDVTTTKIITEGNEANEGSEKLLEKVWLWALSI